MRQLYIPAIALLAFSYPLTTVWLLQADLSTRDYNMAIKALIAVMFALSLLASINQLRGIRPYFAPLFGLFCLYSFRLLYDVVALGIVPPFVSPSYILLYFFGLTFLPALAIGISFDRSDVRLIHQWIFWVLVLTNLSLLFYVTAVGDLAAESAFSGRFEVRGVDDVTAILNPIIVGLMGAVLALFVLGRLAALGKMTALSQLWHLGLFGIGLTNLLIGGSRGPIVGFVAGLLLVTISILYGASVATKIHPASFDPHPLDSAGGDDRDRTGRRRFMVRPRVLLYLVGLAGSLMFLVFSSRLSIGAFDRFRDMYDARGRVIEQRDYISAAAWEDFTNSPFLGHSYLTMNGTALPHNPFLESLTALGIFGGLVYLICFWIFMRGAWNAVLGRVGPYAYSVALAAVALMALSMTSGSLGQSPEVWVMSTLMMCMSSVGLGQRDPRLRDARLPKAAVHQPIGARQRPKWR